ncbi:hypothetical protein EZS27_040671 [termite gut metagenome]|uniref:Transposase IS4-like domain-containing protein n=1 Tax=termite gut metagenome TaxID=433724 RepID=A0A5J4PDW2_9ZZZZ
MTPFLLTKILRFTQYITDYSIVVDKNGFLLAVMVTVANVHDSKAAYLLMRVLKELGSSVKIILADGRYRGAIIEGSKRLLGMRYKSLLVPTKSKNSDRSIKGGL